MSVKKLSKASKVNYKMRIDQYLRYVGMDPDAFVKETKKNPKGFEKQFIAFLEEVGKGVGPSTVAFARDSLRRFLEVNRVKGIDWDYIGQFIPERKRFGNDRAPTVEEIGHIVSNVEIRLKCLILFLASSGARIGAIEYLKWQDIEPVEASGYKFAKVTIYRGEKEQYLSFVSPETFELFQEYRKMRENMGEAVTSQSFVFVTLGNVDNFRPDDVRPISVSTMKNLLGRVMRQMNMRSTILESKEGRTKRFEFKQAHGFRKFFKTRMEVAGVKPIITEMLMGHAIGVANSYMKPSTEELMEEYARGIPALTILSKEKEKADIKSEMKKQLLLVAGFKPEEIEKVDLSKTSDEEFQKMVRERLLGVMANNGSRQKVINTGEVEQYIQQGWEYVAPLSNERAILKLPF